MKRITFAMVACVMALLVAAPAMALDLTATGSLRTRSFFDSNVSLNSETDDSSAWYDMRLRVVPVLTVSENLAIHGRFDVLDDVVWGTELESSGSTHRDTDWDRLWMVIKTDYGKLEIGRMTGATWGTSFLDSATDADRIKYVIGFDNIALGAVLEKGEEKDSFFTTTDSDYDKYFIFGNYASEMITGGLLVGWYQDKRSSDDVTKYAGPCPVPGPFNMHPFDREFWFFNPYGIVKIDDITVQGEVFYHIGKLMEYDRKQYDAQNKGLKDWDYDAWAWNLEGRYDMGPFNFQLGYAWMQGLGQLDAKSDKWTSIGTVGEDWQKLWILTGNEDDHVYEAGAGPQCGLGNGWGNLSDLGSPLGLNGAKIIYVGAGFKPIENLSLNVIYGNAKAEAPISDKLSKDYGSEYDFTLVWNIMDNLEYTFIAAYLDAGDFFKGAKELGNYVKDLENNYSLFQEIKLSF